MADKLNRTTGNDFEKEFISLNNKINQRLKFLMDKFPDIILPYDPKSLPITDNIIILKHVEFDIIKKYNNHSQGTLFDDI